MTAQITEKLIYQGKLVSMCTNPLDNYFAMGGHEPGFRVRSTALWRGYVGSWEIIDDRLYLISLEGTLNDGTEASLVTLFPEFPTRVFAHWYSGTIRTPQGKQVNYVHLGYCSEYEKDLLLTFERGVEMDSVLRNNDKTESQIAAESNCAML